MWLGALRQTPACNQGEGDRNRRDRDADEEDREAPEEHRTIRISRLPNGDVPDVPFGRHQRDEKGAGCAHGRCDPEDSSHVSTVWSTDRRAIRDVPQGDATLAQPSEEACASSEFGEPGRLARVQHVANVVVGIRPNRYEPLDQAFGHLISHFGISM